MHDGRVKVLFFIPALVPGGAERVTITLLRNLSRDRFDVTLAVVSQQGSVFSEELPPDIPLVDLKASRLRYGLLKILRHIWDTRPDVVFSTVDYFNVTLGVMRPFWPRRTRFVARPTILFSAALLRNRQAGLWRALTKVALSNTDLLVFQSSAMEQDYRKSLNWYDESAVVIPNPVDVTYLREQQVADVPDGTNYDPTAFNLVAAGRLEEQKGFDLAIEAIALAKNANVHLTILGEGSRRGMLENLVRERNLQDRVHLIGYRHNPYPFYTKADGFLLSSRFEGFPNVVLEALFSGTPVVATPIAGLNSMLEGIPQCEVSSSQSVSDLAEAIDRFVLRGKRRVDSDVISRFDARHVVLQYEEIFAKAGAWRPRAERKWSIAR